MIDKREKAATSLGLMVTGGFTQGSSFVATLGFGMESLWDSDWEIPKGIRRSAGFPTCCIADFQIGSASKRRGVPGLETRDTADLEVCAAGSRMKYLAKPPHPDADAHADCPNKSVGHTHF
jgi:hypothetical protein